MSRTERKPATARHELAGAENRLALGFGDELKDYYGVSESITVTSFLKPDLSKFTCACLLGVAV